MAFEGVEKRLEIVFSKGNLRQSLTRPVLEKVLGPVECTIESVLTGEDVDAYLLSASSCFVYRDRIIIKTCGETKIFKCVKQILLLGDVDSVFYSRGTFFWPEKQPPPHNEATEENHYLEKLLKSVNLDPMDHMVTGMGSNEWHVMGGFSTAVVNTQEEVVTLEMCMKELDPEKAKVFYKKRGSNMTDASGIRLICPEAMLDSYEFKPCGYSMNGVEGVAISTIHVSREDGWSFASFETFRYSFRKKNLKEMVGKVLACFLPKTFTLVVRSTVKLNGDEAEFALNLDGGYACSERKLRHLPQGSIIYHSFSSI